MASVLASHGLADLERISAVVVKQIVQNTGTHVVLRQSSAEDAEAWARILGREQREELSRWLDDGRDVGSGSAHWVRDFRVPPEDLIQLGPGDALVQEGALGPHNPRDLSILRDVVGLGAVTVDQIGRWHVGSVLTAYGRLKALVDAGYLRGERVFYHRPAAYVGTRAGAEAAGSNLPPARTAVAQLRHHLLVADLADWLPDAHPRAGWVTARELGARAMSGARDSRSGRLVGGVPHVPDGCLVLPDGHRVAVGHERSPRSS